MKSGAIVNSFRFAIRQTARIAFRAFFVVGETEDGASTMSTSDIYPGCRSRLQSAVCEESKRWPDFPCMTERSAVRSPVDSPPRNEWKAETSERKLRRLERGGKLARGKIRGREGGERKKREYAEKCRAHIYDRRIADRVAFKIDPVFRNREDPLTRSYSPRTSHMRLSPVDSRLFARLCASPTLSMGDTSGTRYLREICMIHWFMSIAAHRVAPIPDVFQRAYELRRFLTRQPIARDGNWYINDQHCRCCRRRNAVSSEIDPLSFISLLCVRS